MISEFLWLLVPWFFLANGIGNIFSMGQYFDKDRDRSVIHGIAGMIDLVIAFSLLFGW